MSARRWWKKKRCSNRAKRKANESARRLTETYRLHLAKEISSEAFERSFRPIEERQDRLVGEIPKLQAEVDLLKVDSFSRDQVMNDANSLQAAWPRLDRQAKRKIVEWITNKIVVSKDEIAINLFYLPSRHVKKGPEPTGLEPATSAVTGRRSNQLS